MRALRAAMLASFLALSAAPAHALVCFVVIDRDDTVIYRATLPPVDMSAEGDAMREALRARRQHLMFVEFDRCPEVSYRFGEAGSRSLSIDSAIDGMPPAGRGNGPGAAGAPVPR